jgi:hypothetical protein
MVRRYELRSEKSISEPPQQRTVLFIATPSGSFVKFPVVWFAASMEVAGLPDERLGFRFKVRLMPFSRIVQCSGLSTFSPWCIRKGTFLFLRFIYIFLAQLFDTLTGFRTMQYGRHNIMTYITLVPAL